MIGAMSFVNVTRAGSDPADWAAAVPAAITTPSAASPAHATDSVINRTVLVLLRIITPSLALEPDGFQAHINLAGLQFRYVSL